MTELGREIERFQGQRLPAAGFIVAGLLTGALSLWPGWAFLSGLANDNGAPILVALEQGAWLLGFLALLAVALLLIQQGWVTWRSFVVVHERGLSLSLPRFGGWRLVAPGEVQRLPWSAIVSVARRRRTLGAGALFSTSSAEVVIETRHGLHVLNNAWIDDPLGVAARISTISGLKLQDRGETRHGWPARQGG